MIGDYDLSKFEIDKKNRDRTPKQVCGEPMMEWFPEKQHPFMWSIIAKYPIPDLQSAFKVCQDNNIRNVAYMAGILRNRFGRKSS